MKGHELMHVGCGLACCLETGFGIVRASHERFCRRTSADYTRGQATFASFSAATWTQVPSLPDPASTRRRASRAMSRRASNCYEYRSLKRFAQEPRAT